VQLVSGPARAKEIAKKRKEFFKYGDQAYKLLQGAPAGNLLLKTIILIVRVLFSAPWDREDQLVKLWTARITYVLKTYYGSVEVLRILDEDLFVTMRNGRNL